MRALAGRSRKLPKQSRRIPLPGNSDRGDGLDHGKYFMCWNCGFVCDVDRDELGDAETRAGDNQTSYSTPAYGNAGGNAETALEDYTVVMELGPDGTAKGVRHPIMSDVTGGCPFCGSKNWRGDY
jgi:hypothetical protein